ncbi:SMP-30/gluconolactonase/LRE family protein [Pirellulales bacterium]|nr:SMP-30/gluconolactonase/LRE family protein [Pirellulales bacterium]
MNRLCLALALCFILTSATIDRPSFGQSSASKPYATLGSVERHDSAADQVLSRDARMEILAEGFEFSEGPVWMPEGQFLLFSDIPRNTVFRWDDKRGLSIYLRPSGYVGVSPRSGEPGSNGLLRDHEGRLILMEHGDRRVTRLDDPHRAIKTVLADRFQGKRLNSPNDGVLHSNGDLYFSDPPYGLTGDDDPAKELDFQGVYRLTPDGKLSLLTRELSRPNGMVLSPDEKTLYVANSDPDRVIWMAYDVKNDGALANGRVFQDRTDAFKHGKKGLPDGMCADEAGRIYATGPGGVLIFLPDGTHIATLDTGYETGNCTFGGDGSQLYITAHMVLARIQLKSTGLGF